MAGSRTQALPREEYDSVDRGASETTASAEAMVLSEKTEPTVFRASRGRVEVRFALAGAERRRVQIDVFNVAGRRVSRLVETDLEGGRYGASWSGLEASGGRATSGVYLIRMRAGTETRVQKAVLLR